MNQTRRQFFKTIAATAAGVVAVGVAPAVVKAKSVSFKPNQAQEAIMSGRLYFVNEHCKLQTVTFSRQCDPSDWESYYDKTGVPKELLTKL